MRIRFYWDSGWFADLPSWIEQGGTKEDLAMISGADTWLDNISFYTDEVTLEISKEPLSESLHLYHKDEFGATYIAHEYKGVDWNHQLWLCNVTIFVLGEFPPIIYYQKVK